MKEDKIVWFKCNQCGIQVAYGYRNGILVLIEDAGEFFKAHECRWKKLKCGD